MLHWLAGQKAVEEPTDPDATGAIDMPETPAPVFAVRAFKHAIFGTPQTAQPRPRRHSNTEASRTRTQEGKSQRPPITRPKSASYTHEPTNIPDLVPEPMNSPTKGILLTPGTAAAKRKTVSFGDYIKDKQENPTANLENGNENVDDRLHPWNDQAADDGLQEVSAQKTRNGSSLTKALEQVRDESAKRKRAGRDKTLEKGERATHPDSLDLHSESGKYWKAEYDAYRENTQREVRKLLKKQQMAKSYAKAKDDECLTLANELRQERSKVEKLEMQAMRLAAQLKECQALLRDVQSLEKKPQAEAFVTQNTIAEAHNQQAAVDKVHQTVRSGRKGRLSEQKGTRITESVDVPVSRDIREVQTMHEEGMVSSLPKWPESTAQIEKDWNKDKDDIWAPSFSATSPIASKKSDGSPVSPTVGRTVTSGTGATPLKSLSINTLPRARMTRRDSAQPSPPTEAVVSTSPTREVARKRSSPVLPLAPPAAGIERVSPTGPRGYRSNHRKADFTLPRADSLAVSSPSQSEAPFTIAGTQSQQHDTPGDLQPLVPQDSQLPNSEKRINPQNALKPSAAWTAIRAPSVAPVEKRVTSITDKHGNEVAQDRLEAAKARLRAKGRNVT